MKKVIGVALAASLVAGMAFADVAVTLNNNVRTNMYHQKKTVGITTDADERNDKDTTETYIFDLNGANPHGGTADGQKGELGFSANNDYSGAVFKLKLNGKDNSVSFDGDYYGYMSFGGLKLTFGKFDSRFVNRYNVSAGEEGLVAGGDLTKYGTGLLNSFYTTTIKTKNATAATATTLAKPAEYKTFTYSTNILKDANNATAVAGSKTTSLVADYTFNDVAGGKLLVKAGLLTNAYKIDEDDADSPKYQKAGYVGELDFDNDAVKLQALVKAPNEKQTVFGIFAEPKLMKELPLAFGFSYGQDKDEDKKYQGTNSYKDEVANPADETKTAGNTGKYTAMAFDARVGYLVNDQLKISTAAKYESLKADDFDKTISALSLGAEVSYIVNDLATVFGDVGYYNYNLTGEDAFAKVAKVSVRPGVKLSAGSAAAITAAFQYDNYSGDNKAIKNEWSIPVFFKVAL